MCTRQRAIQHLLLLDEQRPHSNIHHGDTVPSCQRRNAVSPAPLQHCRLRGRLPNPRRRTADRRRRGQRHQPTEPRRCWPVGRQQLSRARRPSCWLTCARNQRHRRHRVHELAAPRKAENASISQALRSLGACEQVRCMMRFSRDANASSVDCFTRCTSRAVGASFVQPCRSD